MAAGTPTAQMPMMTAFLKLNILGLTHTEVCLRLTYNSTKKYRQATTLERKVANPAPAAPMSNPQGRIKMGSRMMFKRHPLMVPMLACKADPSARTR